MAVTGKQIPNSIYADNFQWWITSAPPYYCYNAGPIGADDLSSGGYWIGTSFTANGSPGVPAAYTNGVKFTATTDSTSNPGNLVQAYASAGTPYSISILNDGVKNNPYLQSSYQIGSQGEPLFFGPYPLNKTANSTVNVADGDIILITTGSDVIGGTLLGGSAYGPLDNRQWNLIFYSTGSANVERLSEYVGDTSITGRGNSGILPTYATAMRAQWYTNTGVGGFVAIRSVASATEITWWPLTYDDNNVTDIISRNDS